MRRISILTAVFAIASSVAFAQSADEKLRRRAATLRKTATQMSGLDFSQDVTIGIYGRAQLREFLIRDHKLSMPSHVAGKITRVGAAFGFWASDFDIAASQLDLMTQQIAGFYDPRSKELKIIRDAEERGATERALEEQLGIALSDVYLLHELHHAAQDQHHDLGRFMSTDDSNDDLSLAMLSLVEGEAAYLHTRFMFKGMYNQAKFLFMDPQPIAGYPDYMTLTLQFPYTHGMNFVDRVAAARKTKAVSELFKDPPLSTEQILHPDKWLAEKRDHPTELRMRFAPISKKLGKSWRRQFDNVHGEYVIRLMFRKHKLQLTGTRAAEGWDGDRYTVYHRASDGRLLALWATTWDTEKDAEEFAAGYARLLKKKHKGFRKAGSRGDGLRYTTRSAGEVLIERRGRDVVILEGADEGQLEIIDLIWGSLQKREIRSYSPPETIFY